MGESMLGSHAPPQSNPAAELTPLVYDELRRLAACYLRREGSQCTLQPTSLVHEAYVRLAEWPEFRWRDRAQFFGAAALVMRRVLAEAGRRRDALKRGGGTLKAQLTDAAGASIQPLVSVLELDLAIDRLTKLNPAAAKVLELRIFGGLTVNEAADFMRISPATVKRHWTLALAWIVRELG
jgi:RNA polymerase sigma factor (TIGR02999 family)